MCEIFSDTKQFYGIYLPYSPSLFLSSVTSAAYCASVGLLLCFKSHPDNECCGRNDLFSQLRCTELLYDHLEVGFVFTSGVSHIFLVLLREQVYDQEGFHS